MMLLFACFLILVLLDRNLLVRSLPYCHRYVMVDMMRK